MTNRKSIFPSQPAGCWGPKSGMPMSHTTPLLLELASVDEDDEVELAVELEVSAADTLEDDPAVDSADSAGAVETPGWVMPPKLDEPGPSPQAVRLLTSARVRWARMGSQAYRK